MASVGPNDIEGKIKMANYFYPLLFNVNPTLKEIEFLIYFYDQNFDSKIIRERFAYCKQSSEMWLGSYGYMPEPKKSNEQDSVVKLCNAALGYLDYAENLEITNQFRIQLNDIRKCLNRLQRISREELKYWNWNVG